MLGNIKHDLVSLSRSPTTKEYYETDRFYLFVHNNI